MHKFNDFLLYYTHILVYWHILQLIKFFDELRYGKKDNTEDLLFFDRRDYSGSDSDVYFDRRKYNKIKSTSHENKTEEVINDHHVSFQSEQVILEFYRLQHLKILKGNEYELRKT